jgi:hypothetical protein
LIQLTSAAFAQVRAGMAAVGTTWYRRVALGDPKVSASQSATITKPDVDGRR